MMPNASLTPAEQEGIARCKHRLSAAQEVSRDGAARTRKGRFTQSDVTKAIRGALLAGAKVHGMSIDSNGRMIIHFDEPRGEHAGANSWDDVLT